MHLAEAKSHCGLSLEDQAEEFNFSLLGPAGKLKVWHGSLIEIDNFRHFTHFGTREAAVQRLKDLGIQNGFLHEVELEVLKSLWIDDCGLTKHDPRGILESLESPLFLPFDKVSEGLKSPEHAARLLQGYGYDTLVYKNGREDKGSLSWVALNPIRIQILDVIKTKGRSYSP